MRVGVIPDLHGRKPLIPDNKVDVFLVVGDLCGDQGIRSLVNKSYKEFMKNKSAQPWYEICGRRKARRLIKESLKKGRRTLELLDKFGVPVLVIPGNWDWTGQDSNWKFLAEDHYSSLFKGLNNCFDIDSSLVELNGIDVIGYGRVNGPELLELRGYDGVNDEELRESKEEYEELKDYYDMLFSHATQPVILLSHNVPYNTPLDIITKNNSPRKGFHYGSVLAKDMILKHKPLCCVAGHMHEHFGMCEINSTVCINAGFGREKETVIEIKGSKIKRVIFYPEKEAERYR